MSWEDTARPAGACSQKPIQNIIILFLLRAGDLDFVDREFELKLRGRVLTEPSPQLFVLYGRRRVGKTALVRKACSGLRHVFFTAPPSRVDLALFSRSGFTPDLEREAADQGVLLATIEDVLGMGSASA